MNCPSRRSAKPTAERTDNVVKSMEERYINITPENIATEHLCCIIRTKKPHPGVETKRAWLAERLKDGHVFRKLNAKECAFIEYAPLEKAWTPTVGENYMYIYCLWVTGEAAGHGYGKELMEYCIEDAKAHGKSGVCMLGAKKQKAWLSDRSFAEKFGFSAVDSTNDGYELLALSLDGSLPHFTENAKKQSIESKNFTVFYDDECPYIPQRVEKLCEYCAEKKIPLETVHIDSLEKAKSLPCVFNNWAVFYGGKFVTVNQLDGTAVEKIVKKGS